MQESANFTIPSPALSITMFLLLFAILTCEAHLIFAAREAEPVLCLLDVNNFFGSASLQHWEGNGTPLRYSCLENPMDGGAWWAAVHGVAKSQTRLHFHFSLSCIGEGNGNPLQCSCLENPKDGGAWWAALPQFSLSHFPSWTLSFGSKEVPDSKQHPSRACQPDFCEAVIGFKFLKKQCQGSYKIQDYNSASKIRLETWGCWSCLWSRAENSQGVLLMEWTKNACFMTTPEEPSISGS